MKPSQEPTPSPSDLAPGGNRRVVRFDVGGDVDEFRRYYRTAGWAADLGATERDIVRQDPVHLILMREGEEVVGHAIWHESNPSRHPSGEPREPADREALRSLLREDREFVELHELWLRRDHRGRGIGARFFAFFEDFLLRRGHRNVVFYAFHPAAIALCRKRGYAEREVVVEGETMKVFHKALLAVGEERPTLDRAGEGAAPPSSR